MRDGSTTQMLWLPRKPRMVLPSELPQWRDIVPGPVCCRNWNPTERLCKRLTGWFIFVIRRWGFHNALSQTWWLLSLKPFFLGWRCRQGWLLEVLSPHLQVPGHGQISYLGSFCSPLHLYLHLLIPLTSLIRTLWFTRPLYRCGALPASENPWVNLIGIM